MEPGITSPAYSMSAEPARILGNALPYLDRIWTRDSYLLGGGTALAMRWGHRASRDIDLFMRHIDYARGIHRDPGKLRRVFNSLADQAFFTRWDVQDTGVRLQSGDRELTLVGVGVLRAGPEVHESGIVLESTATILAKKMRGRMTAARGLELRDAYDLLTAKIVDPETLDAVLDSLGTKWFDGFLDAAGRMERTGAAFNDPHEHRIAEAVFPEFLAATPDEFARAIAAPDASATPLLVEARDRWLLHQAHDRADSGTRVGTERILPARDADPK